MLLAPPAVRSVAPDGVIAVEVRNPEFLTPAFVEVPHDAGATCCRSSYPKMPSIVEQGVVSENGI